jgi:hypothetical protein
MTFSILFFSLGVCVLYFFIGTQVVDKDTVIAGRQYFGDYYSCQACPDPLMSMQLSSGKYSCTCPAGYTLLGVSGIGEQACTRTTLTVAHQNDLPQAAVVTYYDPTGAAGNTTIFLH